MMHIRIEKENGDQLIIIESPLTKESATINASIGGTLLSLQLKKDDQIHELIAIPYQDKYALKDNPFYPSGLLMPWVNRVRNGNYSFLGKNYQLPINETNLGNAIHGFLAHKPFVILQQTINEEIASITLSYNYDGSFDGYPFPFEGYLTYSLDIHGKFEVTIAAKNTGKTSMPFATGWHPYFKLGENLNDQIVYFNAVEKYLSDSQMIPLKAELFSAKEGMKLVEEKPDNVYLLEKTTDNTVTLINTKKSIALHLTFDATKFPYFIAFCPENEECIALEPMTGNTDCFNTFEGLLTLEVNQSFTGAIKINISEIGQN